MERGPTIVALVLAVVVGALAPQNRSFAYTPGLSAFEYMFLAICIAGVVATYITLTDLGHPLFRAMIAAFIFAIAALFAYPVLITALVLLSTLSNSRS